MAEFTRGTWKLKPDTAIISANSKPVAYVYDLLGDNSEPPVNARLIENAPVMFRILEELSQELYEYGDEYRQIYALLQKIRCDNKEPENERILPCPFCGNNNISITRVVQTDTFKICCDDCECVLYTGHTNKDKAVAEWNTRANIEKER